MSANLAVALGGIAFAASVAYSLTSVSESVPTPLPTIGSGQAWLPVQVLDPETGCLYLSTHTGGALTPRMDANGKHMCNALPPKGGAK